MDGLCLITRRAIATAIHFDADTFDGWHLYDVDFSFRVYRAGHKTGICCDMPYIHASTSVQTRDNAFTGKDYQKYMARFAAKYPDKILPDFRASQGLHMRTQRLDGPDRLKKLWREETFRRVTLALSRDAARRDDLATRTDS
jgi:GT2 family glycosyltransferase